MISYYVDIFIASSVSLAIGVIIGWILRKFWEVDSLEETGELYVAGKTLQPRQERRKSKRGGARVDWFI